MRLAPYDLADIRLRHAVGATTREDVEALLAEHGEVCDEAAALRKLNAEELLEELESLREDAREGEAFERGAHAVMGMVRTNESADRLFNGGVRFAAPWELCSICSPGHARDGTCTRHGKKVRGLWTETDGPTQNGAVHLAVYALPLFELLAQVVVDAVNARTRAAWRRAARRAELIKLSKPKLLARAASRGVPVSPGDTKDQIAERLSALDEA